MLSSLLEAAQNKNRTNSAEAICYICKSHINFSIFMDILDSCPAKMLEQDENETTRVNEYNSITNDEANSFLNMLSHIAKERIEDMVKRNTSIEEEVDLLVNEYLENITSEKYNADLISINNLQDVRRQYSEES